LTSDVQHTEQETFTHRRIMIILTGLMLGMLLAALDQTIVATALPTIAGDLGGLTELSWVVTAYLLASTATVPLYGKIGDILGRKVVFQAAIVVFLGGSILAGLSQTMFELVAFRAIQGIGAGGLMSLALAIVGDVIPPRQRGRYQGYFGAVFGLASVAGPLLGGFFTDHLTWRWVFYVNIPLGLIALFVTSFALDLPFSRGRHKIDFTGAGLLSSGVVALLLALEWGGNTYPWGSATIIGLLVGAAILIIAFVGVETRTSEPILPMRLFRNRTYSVSNLVGFFVGLAMFGAIVYLPLFLQISLGESATNSGFLLTPMMLGIITASVVSGRLISKFGRYRMFPILGTAIMVLAMYLLSTLGINSASWQATAYMVILGLGIGNVMQVMVLAVQNSVEPRDMGVATSSAQFFRSIGGTVGVAVLGSILVTRLTDHMASSLAGVPGGSQIASHASATLNATPAQLAKLPGPILHAIQTSLADSMSTVFTVALFLVAIAFLLSLMLKEIPLRENAFVGTEKPAHDAGDDVLQSLADTPQEVVPANAGVTSGRGKR
jgi:EmrB/QacA subfamily drug resistance transporter